MKQFVNWCKRRPGFATGWLIVLGVTSYFAAKQNSVESWVLYGVVGFLFVSTVYQGTKNK